MKHIRIEEHITGDELKGVISVEIRVIRVETPMRDDDPECGRKTLASFVGDGSTIELSRAEAFRGLAYELAEKIP